MMIEIEDAATEMENEEIKGNPSEGECCSEADTECEHEGESGASEEHTSEESEKDPEESAESHEENPDEAGNTSSDVKKDSKVEELKDRLMRQMAEFDNYRKRTEKEKKANYEIGAADFITKILPVVDNFERGFDALENKESDDPFVTGMDLIYKQLLKILEDEGVTVIEAVGKPFDPAFHNAVMQQESDEYESGIVITEFQKGYLYKERVLRHSMVVVAQ